MQSETTDRIMASIGNVMLRAAGRTTVKFTGPRQVIVYLNTPGFGAFYRKAVILA